MAPTTCCQWFNLWHVNCLSLSKRIEMTLTEGLISMAFTDGVRGLLLGGAMLAAGSGAALAAPNLASNGSFETCSATASCSTAQLGYAGYSSNGSSFGPVSGANLLGWTNTSTYAYVVTSSAMSNGTITLPNAGNSGNPSPAGTISMYSFPTLSPSGGNFIIEDANYNLNSGSTSNAGGVSQTIGSLTVGQIYQVGFYEAAAQQTGYSGSTGDTWNVTFGGTTQASQTLAIQQGGFSGWVYNTLNFVATSTSQVLSFAATGTGAPPFVALDGVSVSVAVPEPSTWAVFGVALLGLGMVARKRLRRG